MRLFGSVINAAPILVTVEENNNQYKQILIYCKKDGEECCLPFSIGDLMLARGLDVSVLCSEGRVNFTSFSDHLKFLGLTKLIADPEEAKADGNISVSCLINWIIKCQTNPSYVGVNIYCRLGEITRAAKITQEHIDANQASAAAEKVPAEGPEKAPAQDLNSLWVCF